MKKFFATIFAAIAKFLHLLKDDAAIALTDANNFVNSLKAWAATPIGELTIATIQSFAPAKVAASVTSWLAETFVALKWATAEEGKPDAQIVQDGLTYVNSLTGALKAAQLNNLNALAAVYFSADTSAPIDIQHALTAAQAVYDPTLAGTVEAPTETEVAAITSPDEEDTTTES